MRIYKYKDYSGQRFGKLVVLERVFKEDGSKDTIWRCMCDCGKIVEVFGSNFKRTKSCGCLSIDNRKHQEVIGVRKGKLVVIEELESKQTKHGLLRFVLCRCDCGNLIAKRLTSMFYVSDRSGDSCGCLKSEAKKNRVKSYSSSPIKKHPLYHVWKGMKDRCNSPSNQSYGRYGGRGIKVCEEWKFFVDFYNWAVSTGYRKGLSIDRKDNDGIYEPSNCRWATAIEQANNTRANVFVLLDGTKMTLANACRKLGITKVNIVRQRMNRDGWSFEEAIKF